MRAKLFVAVIAGFSLLNSALVLAEEESSGWSGNVAAGYLKSTGNTEESNTDIDLGVTYTAKPWEHSLQGRVNGSTDEEGTSAEAYSLKFKSTYDFDPKNYSFGALNWNKDRFAGYTRQIFATVGYGRRILNNETFVLNAEIGAGYTKQWPSDAEKEDGASAAFGGDFTWNFSKTASFEQKALLFLTDDNNFWESTSSVKSTLTETLALVVSYTIKRNSDAPGDDEKEDTLTSIRLDYSF
jgi:putative salt-induced outer membrane protein